MATARPPRIPPPLVVTRLTVSPVSVATYAVVSESAEISARMITIGMAQTSRKNVVNRSSFAG